MELIANAYKSSYKHKNNRCKELKMTITLGPYFHHHNIYSFIVEPGNSGIWPCVELLFLYHLDKLMKKSPQYSSINLKKTRQCSQVMISVNFGKEVNKEIVKLLKPCRD